MTLARRNDLIEQHRGLVYSIAKRLQKASNAASLLQFDDLVSAGNLGLTHAAARYDESRGTKPATFVATRIYGAMIDLIRSEDALPRPLRRRITRIETLRDEMTPALGREPSFAEVVNTLGLSRTARRHLAEGRAFDHRTSLDDPAVQPTSSDHGPADTTVSDSVKAALHAAIDRLPARQRDVILSVDLGDAPQAEVAERWGLTPSRVSLARREAIAMLREMLTGTVADPAA